MHKQGKPSKHCRKNRFLTIGFFIENGGNGSYVSLAQGMKKNLGALIIFCCILTPILAFQQIPPGNGFCQKMEH